MCWFAATTRERKRFGGDLGIGYPLYGIVGAAICLRNRANDSNAEGHLFKIVYECNGLVDEINYTHPMKEDVKRKNFSPPLGEMRVE